MVESAKDPVTTDARRQRGRVARRTARWSIAVVVSVGLSSVVAGPSSAVTPVPVRLTVPERPMTFGRVEVSVEAAPDVASVSYWLDGERVSHVDEPPFAARLRLGPLPERRVLEAVAHDEEGAEVGRDRVVLNRGFGGHTIRFLEPKTLGAGGTVDVLVDVDAPPGQEISSVELFWNRSALSKWESPPFETTVELPEEPGFLRAVALNDAGGSAEAILLGLGQELAYRSEASLVELTVVAKDRKGRPVRDLRPSEVEIRERGEPQSLRSMESPEAVPLTVALAVDVSRSMRRRLDTVRLAVSGFAERVLDDGDRAFVVTFGAKPELVRLPTADSATISAAIEDRSAEGLTALWDALAYSLVLLRDVKGRRAVVLLSDGDDSCSRLAMNRLDDLAQRVGVPIYLIWMRDAPTGARPGQEVLLPHMVRRSGGEVLPVTDADDLEDAYRQIGSQLLAQYLMTYSPLESRGQGWRELQVTIDRPGVRALTVSGYWPSVN